MNDIVESESSGRLRMALENSGIGWWQLNAATGDHLEFSDRCKAHFGFSPDVDVHLNDLQNRLHPDDRSRALAESVQCLDGQTPYSSEYRVLWPDGTIHWVSVDGAPFYSEALKSNVLVAFTRDITQRKERDAARERALHDAQERAERDPLTNLLNHRAFHARLESEAIRCQRERSAMAVLMLDVDNFKFFNDVYGHAVGDDLLRLVAGSLGGACRSYDVLARMGGDEFAILLPHIGAASSEDIQRRILAATDGISFQPTKFDIRIPVSLSVGCAIYPIDGCDRREVLRLADERMLWFKCGGAATASGSPVRSVAVDRVPGYSMLDALITAVDTRDRYTRMHSEQVMHYGIMIARELGLDKEMQQTVALAGLLHDIGKIVVPDAILRKPGILTTTEFEIVKKHPQMGLIMASAVPGLERTHDGIQHHHERWDGDGYPFGLAGRDIPLIARILAVADSYSAMTTDRPYRKAMAGQRAVASLDDGAGSQWDPACVDAFKAALARNRESEKQFSSR